MNLFLAKAFAFSFGFSIFTLSTYVLAENTVELNIHIKIDRDNRDALINESTVGETFDFVSRDIIQFLHYIYMHKNNMVYDSNVKVSQKANVNMYINSENTSSTYLVFEFDKGKLVGVEDRGLRYDKSYLGIDFVEAMDRSFNSIVFGTDIDRTTTQLFVFETLQAYLKNLEEKDIEQKLQNDLHKANLKIKKFDQKVERNKMLKKAGAYMAGLLALSSMVVLAAAPLEYIDFSQFFHLGDHFENFYGQKVNFVNFAINIFGSMAAIYSAIEFSRLFLKLKRPGKTDIPFDLHKEKYAKTESIRTIGLLKLIQKIAKTGESFNNDSIPTEMVEFITSENQIYHNKAIFQPKGITSFLFTDSSTEQKKALQQIFRNYLEARDNDHNSRLLELRAIQTTKILLADRVHNNRLIFNTQILDLKQNLLTNLKPMCRHVF